jgi:predicted hydrocarbon binding protein
MDLEKGAIRSRSKDNRVFVLGSRAWSSLLSTVYGKFSSGAAVILYDMGKPYGVEIAKDLELDKTLTSLDISKIGRISGWGNYLVQGDFEFGSFFTFTIKNCVFCQFGKAHEPCHFTRGTMEGIASSIFNTQYDSFVSCTGWESSEHRCEIILKARKKR